MASPHQASAFGAEAGTRSLSAAGNPSQILAGRPSTRCIGFLIVEYGCVATVAG